ncbi:MULTISPECIES: transcription antitermination factor NusB [Pelosinus]|jgi:N utilization substance protein B|uniref:Transcription antitermination protein NusB n=3 Tax=Pelosinus TaxID=365348 RepID=I9NX09_9FIRM|nr:MULTISPECIES: transcription antitermination factor NusB [Pelosinus]AJQ27782.1 NusB antitermination factor [Pelosinus fermentans JBW45]EIW18437.1 transcription antitermination factor NusB [Pelosinus fermentans B4]EIW24451.1 NusB antitermination factor [Pelosinus fermentans A11]MCC5464338.1 transcription antitermination factor NusB [Pelosinus baikalensis]OAM94491.1 NusB antitermination factor [Pelosinus fermentans DSM 17108]
MSRRKAREMALQTLFQLDYNSKGKDEALEIVLSEYSNIAENTKEYAENLVSGTQAHITEIDTLIGEISNEWKIDRMPGIDRNIARIAIYEMRFGNEALPPNVVINEAVELAKLFGTEESSRFVNGILGSLVKKK